MHFWSRSASLDSGGLRGEGDEVSKGIIGILRGPQEKATFKPKKKPQPNLVGPLKNISQVRSFPQVGVKIKHIWNHHLVIKGQWSLMISHDGFVTFLYLDWCAKTSSFTKHEKKTSENLRFLVTRFFQTSIYSRGPVWLEDGGLDV